MNNFDPKQFSDAALHDSLHAMRANIANSRTDRMLRPKLPEFQSKEKAILAEMENRNSNTNGAK